MDESAVQLCILLLLSLWAPVPASSLPGSCVEAGYTECCDSALQGDCLAEPTYCLCDPSCRQFNDCCDDIDEICPPAPISPELLLPVSTTLHTATLLWLMPTGASVNDIYTVLYWEYENVNSTVSRYNVSRIESEIGQFIRVTLTGLQPDVIYEWSVDTSNLVMSSQSEFSNFTTVQSGYLEGLRAVLYNTSSVSVSWLPLQLPYGVQQHKYIIHYTGTRTQSSTLSIIDSGNITVPGCHTIITGLTSHLFYDISVEAIIFDGGDCWSGEFVSSSNATVFVPDSMMVQLRGGPFKTCSGWTEETEREVLDVFRLFIHQTIYNDIIENSVLREQQELGGLVESDLIFCDDDSSSGDSQAIYRATVYSTPNHTVQMFTTLLEQQIVSGEFNDHIQIDASCPVRIHMTSEPLCSDNSKPSTTDCPKTDITITDSLTGTSNCSCGDEGESTGVITLPLLMASLLAVLLLSIFIYLSIVAVVLLIRRRRYLTEHKLSENTTHNTPQNNTYSS